MEKKFHINDNGDVGVCRAQVKPCRFAPKDNPAGNHYSTKAEALEAASKSLSEEGLGEFSTLKKADYSNSKYELEVINDVQQEGQQIFNAWMKRDGVNVGYFQGAYGTTSMGDGKGGYVQSEVRLISWTVETNPKYRNQGVARQLVKELKKHFGVSEIMSGGSYTPEGSKFWSKYLTLLPRKEHEENYESMDFVRSWDEKVGPR